MILAGMQNLTLLDFPGKTACTVFTYGCNFRCPFCHNASLVTDAKPDMPLDVETVYSYLRKRQGLLDGVCITGGEPLLQRDLEDFIRSIRALGYAVKLDTNGSMPERLIAMCESGLIDMVAMDIKNSPALYASTAGTEQVSVEAVNESVRYLVRGKVSYEFRTTVVQEYHDAESFAVIGKWLQGADAYYLQQFRDSGALICSGLHACSPSQMHQYLEIVQNYIPRAALRGIEMK
ncbi:MAG: anaerobic ribonucleoside-triphosphate reductase activating protein [Oscillospiraceae bacterium]|nr:anaerobic ribonucleoside-triphosphate reductase activating protein [Oscillospiraceae bacterium]